MSEPFNKPEKAPFFSASLHSIIRCVMFRFPLLSFVGNGMHEHTYSNIYEHKYCTSNGHFRLKLIIVNKRTLQYDTYIKRARHINKAHETLTQTR